VIVLSYDMGAARPITFRRRDARSTPERDPPMVQVALATSAAPTYFPPVAIPWGGSEQLVLVDGGVVANNPTMVAYLDALAQFRTASPGRDLEMVVASIGTGTPPTEPATYESVSSQSWLSLGADLLGVVFDGTSEIQHEILGGLLGTGDVGGRTGFQVELRDCSLALDDASPANIAALRRLAERLTE
jgi:uncharacterized protein